MGRQAFESEQRRECGLGWDATVTDLAGNQETYLLGGFTAKSHFKTPRNRAHYLSASNVLAVLRSAEPGFHDGLWHRRD